MIAFVDDRYCLCCGEKNPLNLKMQFHYKNQKLLSEARLEDGTLIAEGTATCMKT